MSADVMGGGTKRMLHSIDIGAFIPIRDFFVKTFSRACPGRQQGPLSSPEDRLRPFMSSAAGRMPPVTLVRTGRRRSFRPVSGVFRQPFNHMI